MEVESVINSARSPRFNIEKSVERSHKHNSVMFKPNILSANTIYLFASLPTKTSRLLRKYIK